MFILPCVWIELVVHYIYTHNKNTKADRPKLQVKRTPCGMCPSVRRSGKSIVFVYVTTISISYSCPKIQDRDQLLEATHSKLTCTGSGRQRRQISTFK